jgi:hypothetical protein
MTSFYFIYFGTHHCCVESYLQELLLLQPGSTEVPLLDVSLHLNVVELNTGLFEGQLNSIIPQLIEFISPVLLIFVVPLSL